MMKRVLLMLVIMMVGLCGTLCAQTSEAEAAYEAGRYEEALAKYEALADSAGVSAALLYNMGNAAAEAHDYGKAVVYYERALRLDPSSDRVRSNLAYVSTKVEDANRAEMGGKRLKAGEDEPSFFQSVYNVVARDHSSDLWAVLGAVFFVLSVLAVALYIFSRNVLARKIGFFGAIVSLGATAVFVVFAVSAARQYSSRGEGVLTAYKVALQTEPTVESGSGSPSLTRGTKVRIVGEEADAEGRVTWYRVRLNSDYIGWVRAEDVTVI